jgi:hypothetical protein
MQAPQRVQLAQVNLARLRHPLDSPRLAEFLAATDRINALADRAPGFVWRHPSGHVCAEPWTGDPLTIMNLSVWESYLPLHAYVYRSTHGHYLRRRGQWFDTIATPATALWWLPAGHVPTPADAMARLTYLRTHGPTPQAFTVRSRFDPSGHRERSGRLAAGANRPG